MATPTTVLVDRSGLVHEVLRKGRFIERLSPEEVLTAVDKAFRSSGE